MGTNTFGNTGAQGSSEAGATDKAKQAAAQAKQQSSEVASNATSTAGDVAHQAAENFQDVKHVASQQAGQIASDVTSHVTRIAGETGSQLQQHGFEQTKRAAEGLRQLSDGARALAEGRPQDAGIAGQYVEQFGSKVSEIADRLDSGGLDGVMDDMRRFARRRPGVFLLSAGIVGFAAGRLLRGNQAANETQSQQRQQLTAQERIQLDTPVQTVPAGLR